MTTTDLDMSDSYGLYAGVPRLKAPVDTEFLDTPQKVIDALGAAMDGKGIDAAGLARESGVGAASLERMLSTGVTSVGDAFKVFGALDIHPARIPSAYVKVL